jgi:hypothetical protein
MEMQEFVVSFALPLLRKRKGASVCEIGSRFGGSANLLATLQDGAVTIIDPCLDCDLSEEFKGNPRVTVKKDISLSVLPHMNDPFDLILIDGDHNWYTVYNELKLISERKLLKPRGMIFLHDVEWPWGRRDLYYQPETIPAEYRHEWQQKGIARGKKELLDAGGLFPSYCKATREGGPRNGVLTAIDDFLEEHKGRYAFFRVTDGVGLGIIYRKVSFKDDFEFLPLQVKGIFHNVINWPKVFVRNRFPGLFSSAKSFLRKANLRNVILTAMVFVFFAATGFMIIRAFTR